MARHRRHHRVASRRWIVWVILTLFLLAICAVSVRLLWRWARTPSAFPIRHVLVQGELVHVSSTDIQTLVSAHLSGGFFSLHLADARRALLSQPWLENVSFRREWPDTLEVYIEEHVPLARFGEKGVIGLDGMIFYPDVTSIPTTLPQLTGLPADAQQIMETYTLVNTLSQVLNLSVSALSLDAQGCWRLELSNHITVMLGNEEPIARFRRFLIVYPQLQKYSKTPMLSVDLRYQDGIAVRYTLV